MDPITRKLVETYTQMSEGMAIQDPVTGEWKIAISTNQNFDGRLDDLQAIKKREHTMFNDISTANKKKQTPQPVPVPNPKPEPFPGVMPPPPVIKPKPKPTPGKTPYDDRAPDTSIDAANDPARGGQSGAWGGGAGTPAPERKPFGKMSFDEMEKLAARIKIPKQGPYYTQK